MPRISITDRGRAIGLLESGLSVRQTAIRLNASKSAISSLLIKFRNTGDVKDLKKTGRPKCTNANQNQIVINGAFDDRSASSEFEATVDF